MKATYELRGDGAVVAKIGDKIVTEGRVHGTTLCGRFNMGGASVDIHMAHSEKDNKWRLEVTMPDGWLVEVPTKTPVLGGS